MSWIIYFFKFLKFFKLFKFFKIPKIFPIFCPLYYLSSFLHDFLQRTWGKRFYLIKLCASLIIRLFEKDLLNNISLFQKLFWNSNRHAIPHWLGSPPVVRWRTAKPLWRSTSVWFGGPWATRWRIKFATIWRTISFFIVTLVRQRLAPGSPRFALKCFTRRSSAPHTPFCMVQPPL